MIGQSEVVVIAGAGGLGKSLAALELGLTSVAAGGMGMDGAMTEIGLSVAPGPVVYLGYEDAPFRMKDRVAMIANAWTHGAVLGDTFRGVKREPVPWARGLDGQSANFLFLDGRMPMYAVPGGKEYTAPAATPA